MPAGCTSRFQTPEEKSPVRGRFAPSPSGRMHLGNVFAALLGWLDIRKQKGMMIMRLEDLDRERCRKEYAQWLLDDLAWLGLDWDEGWQGEENSPYMQSKRSPLYEDAFDKLQEQGLLYPCYCSRSERRAASAPHPGEERSAVPCPCRFLRPQKQDAALPMPAWKIIAPDKRISIADGHYNLYTENLAAHRGDFILRRADGVFGYQLAVSVDDGAMAINRVVRGRDLLPSALLQHWLIGRLGAIPPTYCHLPLLVAKDGRKLSKRDGDLSMEALRRRYSPSQIIGFLAHLAGLLPRGEQAFAHQLIDSFSWQLVPCHDIVVEQDLL